MDATRAARIHALVGECRAVLAGDGGMEALQRLLARRRVDVTDAVLATYELLGAAPGALGDAKAIALTSPGRRRELLVHQQVVEALE